MSGRSNLRIGVISDTHGLLRPEVRDAFANVDHILHAGDIGSEAILDALRELAPVTAVRGNVDIDIAGPPTPVTVAQGAGYDVIRVTIGGLKILLTHILPRPSALAEEVRASLEKDSADVVVFGHSHLPHDEKIAGTLYLNPASAGPRRFDLPVSVAILEEQKGDWIATHVPLDQRSVTSLREHMNRLR